MLAACGFAGCGSDYTIDLNSYHIDYTAAPVQSRLVAGTGDITRAKGESEWVFMPQNGYEIAGVIIGWLGYDQEGTEVLGGSGGIVWGKPAIELALQSGQTPDTSVLSDEAKEVLAKYGCAASYLTQHTVSLMAVGASDEINDKLRGLRENDGIYMKGMIVKVKSSKYKGMNLNFNPPVAMLYVMELRLGQEKFLAP
jgi:hypothetical protein